MDTDQTTAITTTDDSNAIASTEAMNQSTLALLTNTFEWLQYAMSLVGTDKHDELSSALTEVNERIAHIKAVHITNYAKLNGAMTMAVELTEQRDALLLRVEKMKQNEMDIYAEAYQDDESHIIGCSDCRHQLEVDEAFNLIEDMGLEEAKKYLLEKVEDVFAEAAEVFVETVNYDYDNDPLDQESHDEDDEASDEEYGL